jgi:hypothetical protein
MKNALDHFYCPIAVRAYATAQNGKTVRSSPSSPDIGHSEWSLIFDTETRTDAAQQLRFGCFQLRKFGELKQQGIFYDSETLTTKELGLIKRYARREGLELLIATEFVEQVFLSYTYDLSALCIGFNLPFDLSRLAIRDSWARGRMRGGFSFVLSESKYRPRLQIKHLSTRSALIQFARPAEQPTTRSMRRQGLSVPPRRGYFLDVKTLASAILSGSWSLDSLAKHLDTPNKKHTTEEHGQTLTNKYLKYAMQDVQVTWECFEKLEQRYQSFGLAKTLITQIYSEASLGKAHLKEMGIKLWAESQPDFPPNILGAIMSSYYGGRSEVHVRRKKIRVLYCDFLSMYPTVCTLMGLWRFVIAHGITCEDATAPVREILRKVRIKDLQKQSFWKKLTVLVKVQPDNDILPVRAKYGSQNQYSIGLNYLKCEKPLWFTLADCIASTLLTGRPPRVIEALRFRPKRIQKNLKPIRIMGKPAYRIDPTKDDFYRRLIDLRSHVKANMEGSSNRTKKQLDTEQLALKICANATSYGIFVELNPTEHRNSQKVMCHGAEPFECSVKTIEERGKYFHPLLATLITGAARLMLAITENLAERKTINWALCDTDSMALAKPEEISEIEFLSRTEEIINWFTPLNPYEVKAPLLKVENINYQSGKKKLIVPLYCWAISAKRYALFNLAKNGKPVIQKASAHGLGHLLPPYENKSPRIIPRPSAPLAELGVSRWQYDFWYLILEAALNGRGIKTEFHKLQSFNRPAVSRYSASTPRLLNWFMLNNVGKSYRDRVKPFNFLVASQAKLDMHHTNGKLNQSSPIAPYDRNNQKALRRCFDRITGRQVLIRELKTYCELLNQYHLHPEAKFQNGDYLDCGFTERRHVVAVGTEHIGKEANRLEEQWFLGSDQDAQIIYRIAKNCLASSRQKLVRARRLYGQNNLARESGVSARHISRILKCETIPSSQVMGRVIEGIRLLEQYKYEQSRFVSDLRALRSRIGLRKLAKRVGIDSANLSHILTGSRSMGPGMRIKLEKLVDRRPNGRYPHF